MKIQRHVRQDFQPVYVKLETLTEAQNLVEMLTAYRTLDTAMADPLKMAETICQELTTIIDAGGILP